MRGRLSIWALCPLVLALMGLAACGGGSGGGGAAAGLTVDAGADVQIPEGTLVTLTATPADPAAAYLWTQTSGPVVAMSGDTTATCTFTAPQLPAGQVEDLVFTCAATLGGATASDSVTVQVSSVDHVLFARGTDTEPRAVYAVETGSGAVTRVSPATATGEPLGNNYDVSPDGQYVAYHVDGDTLGMFEVWVAATDGSGATKVSGILPVFADAAAGAWSPDSSRLLISADVSVDDVREIYTVRPDGTELTRLHAPVAPGDQFGIARWSPDGARVAFTARFGGDPTYRLYVAAADGSSTLPVSKSPPAGAPYGVREFTWSPSAVQIAYRGDLNVDGTNELFVVSATGGPSTTMNDTIVTGGDVDIIVGWSPDGRTVVYRADEDTAGLQELYASTTTGGRLKLSGSMPPGARGIQASPRIAPDGSRVLYLADQVTAGTRELFRVTLSGGGNARVNPALTGTASLSFFATWLPDSSGILYRYTADTSVSPEELWIASATGTSRTRISTAASLTEVVLNTSFSPDGRRVAWVQSDFTGGSSALWTANVDGSGRVQLSPTFAAPVFLDNQPIHMFAADGASIMYATSVTSGPVPGPDNLYVVRADGTGARSIVGSASGTISLGPFAQWLP